MKKKLKEIVGAAVISASIVASLFCINQMATAHADTSNFLRDVYALGISNSEGSQRVINDGYAICGDLNQGIAPEAVAQMFWRNSIRGNGLVGGVTIMQARGFVMAAEVDLCESGGVNA